MAGAGHKYTASLTGAVNVASGTRTLIQLIAPATRDVWLQGFTISGHSVNGADIPVQFDIIRQTTAGTSGGSLTPVPTDIDSPAALATVNITFSSTEPTSSGLVLPSFFLTPVGGLFQHQESLGEEVKIKASGRLGFRVQVSQATDILLGIRFQE